MASPKKRSPKKAARKRPPKKLSAADKKTISSMRGKGVSNLKRLGRQYGVPRTTAVTQTKKRK